MQNIILHEPVSSKRYKLACAPIKDSDQTEHQRSLVSLYEGLDMGSQEPFFSTAQTG